MSFFVSIKVTNNQSGKNVTSSIPVSGHVLPLAAFFSGQFPDGKVVVTVIEVQKPAEANGVNIFTGPANGTYQTLRGDGTPLTVNGGKELDITSWNIVLVRQ